MTRVMYDSVSARSIPSTAGMVGGYDDGAYVWTAADWARFPNAAHVHITVLANPASPVYDCETGNGTPADAVPFAQGVLARGGIPTIYCGLNTWYGTIQADINAAGLEGRVNYWVASYDDVAAIPSNTVAKQYQDPGPYDVSIVTDYWPGVDAEPPPPSPEEVDTVKQMTVPDPQRSLIHYCYLVPAGSSSTFYYRNGPIGGAANPQPIKPVGDALDDNAGLWACLGGSTLHVFCRAANTDPTTGRHYWTTDTVSWSYEPI